MAARESNISNKALAAGETAAAAKIWRKSAAASISAPYQRKRSIKHISLAAYSSGKQHQLKRIKRNNAT